jgi:membrane peptidoglycan carboxypeptidase
MSGWSTDRRFTAGLDVEDARAGADHSDLHHQADVLHRGDQGYLLNRATFLGDEQQRANLLYRGGLKIHTTFDPNLQALAEQARTQLPRTLRDSMLQWSRSTPRPVRSVPWSAGTGSSRA